MTARFDSAHESVVRTPVLAVNAPVTPLPAVIVDRAPATPSPVAGDAGRTFFGEREGRREKFVFTRPDLMRQTAVQTVTTLGQCCAKTCIHRERSRRLELPCAQEESDPS